MTGGNRAASRSAIHARHRAPHPAALHLSSAATAAGETPMAVDGIGHPLQNVER
jgi:hypothetical protein